MAAQDVLDFGAPHVVLATGSTGGGTASAWWARSPSTLDGALTPDDLYAGRPVSGPVVIYDDEHYAIASALAEKLRREGHDVHLVTTLPVVSSWTAMTDEQSFIQSRLLGMDVAITPSHMLGGLQADVAQFSCGYTGRRKDVPCGTLVLVTGRLPNAALHQDMLPHAGALATLRAIGDCHAPGLIADAVYSGHRFAREFGEDAADPVLRRERPVPGRSRHENNGVDHMSDLLRRAILQGQGAEPADLVLKGGRFLDLVSGDLVSSDIAITGDRIGGTFGVYSGRHEIDMTGKTVVPGFIDTHLHVESSLVTPLEFDRCVLRHGVTTAICDPHEIANVLGAEGIRYFLDVRWRPSWTSASSFRAACPPPISKPRARALERRRPQALHGSPQGDRPCRVHEFSGRAGADPGALDKLALFSGRPHRRACAAAPRHGAQRLSRRRHPHRPRDDDGRRGAEKLSKGMHILIREGSVSKDLHALMPHHDGAQLALHRALHGRPEPARHRRGRPSRLHDPHGHCRTAPAAGRLPRGEHLRRARLPAA